MARPHEMDKISAGAGHEAEQHLQPVDDCLAPERIHAHLVAVAIHPRKCENQSHDFQELRNLEEGRGGGVDGLARVAQNSGDPIDA
jgi:hypothetical protein